MGLQGEKEKWRSILFWRVWVRVRLVFLSSLDLISCNFSMIFAHFQTKRDITRGPKPFSVCVGGGGRANPFSGGGAT